jgi:DNA primase
VLYRLTMLREVTRLADIRWTLVVEGEKDVDAAWEYELPATTNPEGAGNGKWKSRYSQQLRDAGIRRVYVIPDNDPVGRLHANQIIASCHEHGLRAWRIELPDLPRGGDLSDFFEAGGTRRAVLRLMRKARA